MTRSVSPSPAVFAAPLFAKPARAASLRRRHADLEERIASELARPAPDALAIRDLKKLRLRVKEALSAHG